MRMQIWHGPDSYSAQGHRSISEFAPAFGSGTCHRSFAASAPVFEGTSNDRGTLDLDDLGDTVIRAVRSCLLPATWIIEIIELHEYSAMWRCENVARPQRYGDASPYLGSRSHFLALAGRSAGRASCSALSPGGRCRAWSGPAWGVFALPSGPASAAGFGYLLARRPATSENARKL